jgi:hypothetical protein
MEKEKEKCVSCGKDTSYTPDVNIDMRAHYVEGAGQLCKECYDNIYNNKEQE